MTGGKVIANGRTKPQPNEEPAPMRTAELPKVAAIGALIALILGTQPLAQWLDKQADAWSQPAWHNAAATIRAIPGVSEPFRSVRSWIDSARDAK